MDNLNRKKAYFPLGKIGKSDFAPSEKYSSYAMGMSIKTGSLDTMEPEKQKDQP